MPAGSPLARLIAAPEGAWILQSAILDRRDTLDSPIEIKPGQDLSDAAITFTDLRTSLSGSVALGRDTTDATPTVVLFAADRQFWTPSSRRVLSARVSTDGRYAFGEVPPGAYRIAAIGLTEPDKLSDAQFLESIEPNAMWVNIAAAFVCWPAVAFPQRQDHRVSAGGGVSGFGLFDEAGLPITSPGTDVWVTVRGMGPVALEAQLDWFPTHEATAFESQGGRTLKLMAGGRGTFYSS